MNLVTKTVYYDNLILSHFREKSFKPLANTTLNEKFNINKTITQEVDTPTLKYYALGNGNLKTIDSESNLKLYHGNHRSIDGALFNHIPFILRKETEDIGINERRNYRLRKTMTIDNIEYVAYYLKIIPGDMVENQTLKITQENDTMPKVEVFNTNDSSILNPTPSDTPTIELLSDSTEYIVNSDQVSITLTVEELQEINDALDILGYSDKERVFNELALCSGTDIVSLTDYSLEVAYCQVMFFVDIDYDIQLLLDTETEFYRQIEIGGMAPLMLN